MQGRPAPKKGILLSTFHISNIHGDFFSSHWLKILLVLKKIK